MAKKKPVYTGSGYSVWSFGRLIREAENVARWNPWVAHAWMEEARNKLSLDAPFYREFNSTAQRINYRWALLKKFRWFDEVEFWELDGVSYKTTYIEYI